MKSFLNYFRQKTSPPEANVPDTLITGDQIIHNFGKAPAVRARLEARTKKNVKLEDLLAKQERAFNFRSEIAKNKLLARKERRNHATMVKRNLVDQNRCTAVKSARDDKRFFAAINRRHQNLQTIQEKAQRHNQEVFEKSIQVGIDGECHKQDLMRTIEQRMKAASLIHGAYLLSVRQHQSIIDPPILRQQPVSFEIDIGQNSCSYPEVAKRLQGAERQEITMEQITHKLTQASILRMQKQAERFAKAKSVTVKVSKVRVNRNSYDHDLIFNSIMFDRKLDAAKKIRQQQLTAKQSKAMSHNELVMEKVNNIVLQYEKSLKDKKDRLQFKIKQAAVNRGCQLLLVRQTAEKLRMPKITDTKPVSFQVEVEKSPRQQAPAVQQRLESQEVHQITIQEIVEKLAKAEIRRNQQREQAHKRLKRGCRRVNRERQVNHLTNISRKLAQAANLHLGQLQAVQIRARLHNELVQTRHIESITSFEAQKIQKFSAIQEKQRQAAENRELLMLKSRQVHRAA